MTFRITRRAATDSSKNPSDAVTANEMTEATAASTKGQKRMASA